MRRATARSASSRRATARSRQDDSENPITPTEQVWSPQRPQPPRLRPTRARRQPAGPARAITLTRSLGTPIHILDFADDDPRVAVLRWITAGMGGVPRASCPAGHGGEASGCGPVLMLRFLKSVRPGKDHVVIGKVKPEEQLEIDRGVFKRLGDCAGSEIESAIRLIAQKRIASAWIAEQAAGPDQGELAIARTAGLAERRPRTPRRARPDPERSRGPSSGEPKAALRGSAYFEVWGPRGS
jgi:hypothetical protein